MTKSEKAAKQLKFVIRNFGKVCLANGSDYRHTRAFLYRCVVTDYLQESLTKKGRSEVESYLNGYLAARFPEETFTDDVLSPSDLLSEE